MSVTKSPPVPQRALRASEHQFVEKLAVAMETDGFPRIAGRIFALLMLTEGDLSLDGIAETLGASKASASVNTRLLEQMGFIERTSRRADRRDYYRIAGDIFLKTMEQRLAKWSRVRAVVAETMEDSTLSPAARGRLRDFEADSSAMRELLEAALLKLRHRRKR